jgi:hypothetical protein
VPREVLFDLEPGVIDAMRVSPLEKKTPLGKLREPTRGRGKQLGQGPLQKGWARTLLNPPSV